MLFVLPERSELSFGNARSPAVSGARAGGVHSSMRRDIHPISRRSVSVVTKESGDCAEPKMELPLGVDGG